jgi:multiple antibiotic resistance protein
VEQALTTVVMLIVLLVVLVLMLSAGAIHRLIGDSGASIVSRVMGMILASVATANVLAALRGSTRWAGQVAKAKPGAATSRLAWSSAALN